jgi:histidinol-phosphate aminotransferase
MIRLDSNENPYGPADAAISAIKEFFGESSRYPDATDEALAEAIAARYRVDTRNLLLGCGSTEILRSCTQAFTTPSRHLVTAAPTFETPTTTAKRIGTEIVAVPVDASLHLDLERMADAADGAGLIYLCNPNNPTATVHGAAAVRQLIERVLAKSPETTILVDEAYFEFVDDPSYGTMIPLALSNPRVVVARTFSKIYGMAGLRVGYAIGHASTIERLATYKLSNGLNVFAGAAARVSLGLTEHIAQQKVLNREARDFLRSSMTKLGFECTPSEANFMMIDVRRDSKQFQATCRARGLAIGRPFPPLTTHARISIGTMDEMHRAMDIVRDALRAT